MEHAILLRDRCIQMLYQGIIQEYLLFKSQFPKGHDMFKGELILPIGFKQIEKLIQDFSKFLNLIKDVENTPKCGRKG